MILWKKITSDRGKFHFGTSRREREAAGECEIPESRWDSGQTRTPELQQRSYPGWEMLPAFLNPMDSHHRCSGRRMQELPRDPLLSCWSPPPPGPGRTSGSWQLAWRSGSKPLSGHLPSPEQSNCGHVSVKKWIWSSDWINACSHSSLTGIWCPCHWGCNNPGIPWLRRCWEEARGLVLDRVPSHWSSRVATWLRQVAIQV